MNIYDFTVKAQDGSEVSLSDYKGKVLLVVNTAAGCGYKTENTCSQLISFDINGNVITNISFYGGCDGNLKAISKLLEGATVEEIEGKLLG